MKGYNHASCPYIVPQIYAPSEDCLGWGEHGRLAGGPDVGHDRLVVDVLAVLRGRVTEILRRRQLQGPVGGLSGAEEWDNGKLPVNRWMTSDIIKMINR
jgi:hypothetical protein